MKKIHAPWRLAEYSTAIAGTGIHGAEFTSDLYAKWITLYKHKEGLFLLLRTGSGTNSARWCTEQEAVDFITQCAVDPVSGYGYTAEQAVFMLEGKDPGKAETNIDDDVISDSFISWQTSFR